MTARILHISAGGEPEAEETLHDIADAIHGMAAGRRVKRFR